MVEQTKEMRIKKEFLRLKKLYRDLPKDKMNLVTSLIGNVAFMTITLEDLQQQINLEGPVSRYQNGENQWGTKKSPEVDIFNTMIKNQSAIVKQLIDLIPTQSDSESDEVLKFALMKK